MRAGLAIVALAGLVALVGLAVLAGCGGGGQDERAERAELASVRTGADTDRSAAADTTDRPQLKEDGYLRTFDEAGFTVFWPSGCGSLREQVSSGKTRSAAQEFIYTCDRDGAMTEGVSVRVFRDAHDADGGPPGPEMVTELVKRQLQKSGTAILRQRPLRADGIEGVDVHAGEPDGSAEVWVRGLLSGSDIFMILAWDKRGGLLENPEVVDFFASFRVAGD